MTTLTADQLHAVLTQAVGAGVVTGLAVAAAVAVSFVLGDLAWRERTHADGFRPFARWRFPAAWRQVEAERRAGFRTRPGERARA